MRILENMVLQANKGIDIQEVSGITFRNMEIITKEANPLIDITQSDKLIFENLISTRKWHKQLQTCFL